ncbi:hypothetical protein BD413DRAFT_161407 [Trametes elegans]|nr:hypothetical protein BD413DRAFT_161407 [Trametes elegans]
MHVVQHLLYRRPPMPAHGPAGTGRGESGGRAHGSSVHHPPPPLGVHASCVLVYGAALGAERAPGPGWAACILVCPGVPRVECRRPMEMSMGMGMVGAAVGDGPGEGGGDDGPRTPPLAVARVARWVGLTAYCDTCMHACILYVSTAPTSASKHTHLRPARPVYAPRTHSMLQHSTRGGVHNAGLG